MMDESGDPLSVFYSYLGCASWPFLGGMTETGPRLIVHHSSLGLRILCPRVSVLDPFRNSGFREKPEWRDGLWND